MEEGLGGAAHRRQRCSRSIPTTVAALRLQTRGEGSSGGARGSIKEEGGGEKRSSGDDMVALL
jgi:hypothetical protein